MDQTQAWYIANYPEPNSQFDIDPRFVAGDDYHLQDNSPCINAGLYIIGFHDQIGVTDLDGNPITQLPPDMGCYENTAQQYFFYFRSKREVQYRLIEKEATRQKTKIEIKRRVIQ